MQLLTKHHVSPFTPQRWALRAIFNNLYFSQKNREVQKIHSFTPQTLIESHLCMKNCSRLLAYMELTPNRKGLHCPKIMDLENERTQKKTQFFQLQKLPVISVNLPCLPFWFWPHRGCSPEVFMVQTHKATAEGKMPSEQFFYFRDLIISLLLKILQMALGCLQSNI